VLDCQEEGTVKLHDYFQNVKDRYAAWIKEQGKEEEEDETDEEDEDTPTMSRPFKASTKKKVRDPSTADDEEVNECETQILKLADNETLFVYSGGMDFSDTVATRNYYMWRVSEDGEQLLKLKLAPKAKQDPRRLLDGYAHCEEGTHWYSMIELALKDLYGGQIPDPNEEPKWKVVECIDLPFAVESTLYEPARRGQLAVMDAPAMQAAKNKAEVWHSFWLRKKGVGSTKTFRRANARGSAAGMFGSP